MKEKVVIKEWDKKGLVGLRTSSLNLLENIGGRGEEGVAGVLIRHTLKALPMGLWMEGVGGGAEKLCREICFVAGVDFDESVYILEVEEEKGERRDEEFGD